MTEKDDQKIKFFKKNRSILREANLAPLIVITANSLMQASADKAYPFVQDSNFFYLTGIAEPGLILVIDSNEEYLIAPVRSKVRDFFEGEFDREELKRSSGIEKIYENEEGWQRLERRLKALNNVGLLEPADNYIEAADMFTNPSRRRLKERLREKNSQLEFVDTRPFLASQRMIKSDYEVDMIEHAISETIGLFHELEKIRKDAESETDLMAAALSYTALKQQKFAFEPIIASGINAVTLHYEKNNGKLEAAQLLLLDIGLKYSGYSADLTRTVAFAGASERQMDVYKAVAEVQDYAVSLLKPGQVLKDYEEKIMNYMGEKLVELGLIKSPDKDAIRRYFPHAVSHFLGIDIHDAGNYERPLEPGMVLTVEPGIYIKEEALGIRIEDNVLITKSGKKVLSERLPRNIVSLTIPS